MTAFLWFMLLSRAQADVPRVTFIPPPGMKAVVLPATEQARIRRIIQEKLIDLERLSALPARPVKVQVFGTREEFVTFTQVPPDFGAVTLDGVIVMQPVAMLDHQQGLRRILEHEAVHHHFYRAGRDWPRNFHEALAHYLSGGKIAESPRATELARKRRTGAEEHEYEAHLAWVLAKRVKSVGVKSFLRALLRGEVDLAAFRRSRT